MKACADGSWRPVPFDGCIRHCALEGGTITVDPNPPCVGETITFTLSGIIVTDGQKRENCAVVSAPVDVTYEWIIGHPPGGGISVGEGLVATVTADAPGQYWCVFYVVGTSDCPPRLAFHT